MAPDLTTLPNTLCISDSQSSLGPFQLQENTGAAWGRGKWNMRDRWVKVLHELHPWMELGRRASVPAANYTPSRPAQATRLPYFPCNLKVPTSPIYLDVASGFTVPGGRGTGSTGSGWVATCLHQMTSPTGAVALMATAVRACLRHQEDWTDMRP